MTTISIEDAKHRLAELIEQLKPGDSVTITRDNAPVATLTGVERPVRPRRQLGHMRGSVLWMAPDFDEPMEEFKEYME